MGAYVLSATLELFEDDPDKILEREEELLLKRREKQPLEYPSAGSAFKRPEGYFAAKLIEDAGLKGVSVGGAQVSEKHSGFIINRGNATAKDILTLAELVKKTVLEKFGVTLEEEARIIKG
jgi:UDP-N-acetylmuramate dehydrogenase